MSWISDPQAWTALAALTVIEIVLGIDNIIFILISVGRLPERQRAGARVLGLLLALATRIGLLFTLTWFMGLTQPLIRLPVVELSLRDLILIGGGLFLLAKSTFEIHGELEIEESTAKHAAVAGIVGVGFQIAVIDIVFSLDSVITAIGLAERVEVMVIAIVIAVGVMLISAKPLGDFVDRHPTVKMLALSFLLLIGTTLIADGLHFHFSKGYVYFAMAFAVLIEFLNMRIRGSRKVLQ